MTDLQTKNTPIQTIRDGALKATIWANPLKDKPGYRYSVEFSRTYKDDADQWQDTSYFSNSEILRIARLAKLAYDFISEVRQAAKSNN